MDYIDCIDRINCLDGLFLCAQYLIIRIDI